MEKSTRVVRLPVESVDNETWAALRAAACKASRFGNRMLAGQYVGLTSKLPPELRKQLNAALRADSNEDLSSWVRGAMENKCKAYWTRSGKDVLAGRARLACFSADRALSIKASLTDNRGVLYEREGDGFVLTCRFEPVEIREHGKLIGKREPIRLRVALGRAPARRDLFIREAVELIWAGAWTPGVLTIRFDPRRRKLMALISYSRPAVAASDQPRAATLGPVDEHGRIFLRVDDGPTVDYSDRVRMLHERKEHFAGLVQRLRHGAGRKGRAGRHQQYRRKLDEVGSFSDWSDGVLHQWSRHVIRICQDHGVGTLSIQDAGTADLPWERLAHQLRYKAEDAGITLGGDKLTDATARAAAAEVRKRTRTIRKAKDGLSAARDLVAAG